VCVCVYVCVCVHIPVANDSINIEDIKAHECREQRDQDRVESPLAFSLVQIIESINHELNK
jgi:hypothetical protein